MIGIYSTQKKMEEAIIRLKQVEGFRVYPDGFDYYELVVDRTSWEEGFVKHSDY